jgi:hypothetical protein
MDGGGGGRRGRWTEGEMDGEITTWLNMRRLGRWNR